jgi:hypothetical protein
MPNGRFKCDCRGIKLTILHKLVRQVGGSHHQIGTSWATSMSTWGSTSYKSARKFRLAWSRAQHQHCPSCTNASDSHHCGSPVLISVIYANQSYVREIGSVTPGEFKLCCKNSSSMIEIGSPVGSPAIGNPTIIYQSKTNVAHTYVTQIIHQATKFKGGRKLIIPLPLRVIARDQLFDLQVFNILSLRLGCLFFWFGHVWFYLYSGSKACFGKICKMQTTWTGHTN